MRSMVRSPRGRKMAVRRSPFLKSASRHRSGSVEPNHGIRRAPLVLVWVLVRVRVRVRVRVLKLLRRVVGQGQRRVGQRNHPRKIRKEERRIGAKRQPVGSRHIVHRCKSWRSRHPERFWSTTCYYYPKPSQVKKWERRVRWYVGHRPRFRQSRT